MRNSLAPGAEQLPARFPRSFEDTVRAFAAGLSDDTLKRLVSLAIDCGNEVFELKAKPFPETFNLLTGLRDQGYRLALITAGEHLVQEKRLREFPFTEIFHWVKWVPEHKGPVFENLSELRINPTLTTVVGDSLGSDIDPAVRAGLRAIWVAHPNWSAEQTTARGAVSKTERGLREHLQAEGLDGAAATIARELTDVGSRFGVNVVPEESLTISETPPLYAYGVFEGGGAMGLAHFGAYEALVDRQIRFLGVAGTSAGSIAAGLIAAGHRPDALIQLVKHTNFLKIIGSSRWTEGASLLTSGRDILNSLDFSRFGVLRFVWNFPLKHYRRLRAIRSSLIDLHEDLGWFNLNTFIEWYDTQLKNGLKDRYGIDVVGRKVLFSDIQNAWIRELNSELSDSKGLRELLEDNGSPLKIFSTNTTEATITVHPDDIGSCQYVADAVAASIAIPAVFQPQALHSAQHVDGGALSNFPAWIFRNRVGKMGALAPIIGLELNRRDEGEQNRPATNLLEFLQALVTTVIAGSKRVSTHSTRELHAIPIPVAVSPFAFDMTDSDKEQTLEDGREAVKAYVQSELSLVRESQIIPLLRAYHRAMLSILSVSDAHLRVNVVYRDKAPGQQPGRLRVLYRFNMEFDPDDNLEFEHQSGGAVGRCIDEQRVVALDMNEAESTYPDYNMTKYEQALVRKSLQALLCWPIPAEKDINVEEPKHPPLGVLNFDTDEPVSREFATDPIIHGMARACAEHFSARWNALAKEGKLEAELYKFDY